MKISSKSICFFLFLFHSFMTLPAQEGNLSSMEIIGAQGVYESAFLIRPEGRYSQVKGSPYLNEEWQDSKVWIEGDTVAGSFFMRYNIYGNEMQFIYGSDTFAVSNPLSIERIEIDQRVFEYLAFDHHDNANMAYFEVLVDGDYRLLVRYEVRLDAGRQAMTPYHPQNDSDHFVQIKTFYIQQPGQPNPQELPDSRKDWLKLAGEDEAGLKMFFEENRIRFHRESDLIRIIEQLNSYSHEDKSN